MVDNNFKQMQVKTDTHQVIKFLAAMKGVNMYELVDTWAQRELENSRVALPDIGEQSPTPTAG